MRPSRLPVLLLASTLAACGAKVITTPHNTADAGPGGVNTGDQLQYMPEGCNYKVTVPLSATNAKYLGTGGTPLTMKPQHVHAGFASDPSTSFAVNWKAEPGATLVQLFYGTNKDAVTAATAATADVKLQYGHSLDVISQRDFTTLDVHVQEAHVCGLTPSTTYYYKVGNTGVFSDVFAITTAPPAGYTGAFRFAVAGDARNNPDIFAQAEAAIAQRGPLFQVFSGDLVDVGVRQDEWDAFFEAKTSTTTAESVLASVPAQMTVGNHDQVVLNYLAQFALPQQAGGGEDDTFGAGIPTTKAWYSYNYGNIHFVHLNDSTIGLDAINITERAWLDHDLSLVNRTMTPWIIVIHHQPIFSCDNVHGSDVAIGNAWQPIFDKYNVDIVLNGHVHNYQRSNFIHGTNVNAPAGQGTLYLVVGSVGAPLYGYNTGTCAFSHTGSSTTNYGIVDVQGNTLKFTAYDLMGGDVQLDQVTLTK